MKKPLPLLEIALDGRTKEMHMWVVSGIAWEAQKGKTGRSVRSVTIDSGISSDARRDVGDPEGFTMD